jgi:tetratricopeptide (TPR) repeat protein
MKKLLIAFFVLVMQISFAQKMKVTSASIALQNGDLQGAIDYIESAMQSEETKSMSYAWLTKGDIYRNVYETKLLAAKYPNALYIAKDAYTKANELEVNPKKKKDIATGLTNIQNYFANEGILKLQSNDANTAYPYTLAAVQLDEYMNKSGLETTMDTNSVFAFTLASIYMNKKDVAAPYLKQLINANFKDPFPYDAYITYLIESGNTQDVEMYIDLARKKFPDESSFLVNEINYYLAKGESAKVIEKLNEGIAKNADNATMYFSRGVTYEKIGELDKAMADYDKATALKPNYLEAIYSKGALFFNQAVEINKKMNDENDMKKYNLMKADRDGLYNKALPYLEKAYQLDKTDSNTILALKEIYAVTNQQDKYSKVKNGEDIH